MPTVLEMGKLNLLAILIVFSFFLLGCAKPQEQAANVSQPEQTPTPSVPSTGTGTTAAKPQPVEPQPSAVLENDGGSAGDAPNKFVDGQIELKAGAYVDNAISATDDIDFYSFTVGAGDRFQVTVAPDTSLDAVLRIYDAGGKDRTWDFLYYDGGSDVGRDFKIDAAIAGKPESFWSQESSAQKSYTKYFSVESKKGTGKYSIALEITPQNDAGSGTDAGDTPDGALEISPGNKDYSALLNYLDTVDCFRLSTGSSASVVVSPGKDLDVSFTVRDQGGKDTTWDLMYYGKTNKDRKNAAFSVNEGVAGFSESITWQTGGSIQHICVKKERGSGSYSINYS